MALTRITKGVIKPNENYDTHNINSTGIVTAIGLDVNGNGDISGNLSVGGVLTYEDVTSIDSVGIITARDGIHVGAGVSAVGVGTFSGLDISGDIDVDGHTNLDNVSVAGVTTITGTLLDLNSNSANPAIFKLRTNVNTCEIEGRVSGGENHLVLSSNNSADHLKITGNTVQLPNDNQRLEIGANQELKIAQDGTHNITYMQNVGPLQLQTDDLRLYNYTTQDLYLRAQTNAGVSLYYDYSNHSTAKLTTTATGVTIDGTAVATGADINGDLDVDGHTNLDNVSIAGVTTMGQATIFTTGGTTLLLKDSDSSNPADRSGIAFVDQNNTQTGFIGKESASDAVLTINNTNTINPIRLKVNNTTRLEVGNTGVYATGSLSATGTLSAGDTLYITDNIQHVGDSNTQIRFPAADTITAETGGSERLRIDSSGRLLVGKTSSTLNPRVQIGGRYVDASGATLDLDTTGSVGPSLELFETGNTANNIALMVFNHGSLKSAIGGGRKNTNNWGTDLRFYTHKDATSDQHETEERMRITSDGRLFIGETSVAGSSNLVIGNGGAENFEFTSGNGNALYDGGVIEYIHRGDGNTRPNLNYYVNNTGAHKFWTGGSERFRITSSGQIGIGTATIRNSRAMQFTGASNSLFLITGHAPSICLNRDPDDSTDGDRSFFGVSSVSNGFANGTAAGDTIIRGNSSGKLHFATGTSIRMSIASGGDTTLYGSNVYSNGLMSIGKNSNAGKAIEIYQASYAALRIQNSSTGTGGSDGILIEAAGSDALFWNYESANMRFGTAGTERLRITSAGHLQLQGGTIYGDDSALPTFTLQNTSGNNNHCRIVLGSNVGSDNGGIEFWTAGSSAATKKFSIRGNNNYIEVIGSNTLRFNDGKLNVSHDASDGYITNNTGDLKLRTNNAERLEITNSGLIQAKTLAGSYYPIASARDGSTSARAATSAWEIKKTLGPAARTGYYYLINPYDGTTSQWWCDMTTDGGGWILVAHTGEGQMASQSTSGDHWWDRNDKGGFDSVGSGYHKGGGYWRKTNGGWGENTCGQLMWDVRVHNQFGFAQYGYHDTADSNSKVVFNWGTDQALPSGNSGLSNIPNANNRRFNDWCYEVLNAPGFNPSNYHQNIRSNTINGANYFTEHMVMTWSFRGTGGAGDAGNNADGPYWMIGSHHDGLHQHYEESLSGGDGVYGDGGYQVVSNQDSYWANNPSGTNNGMRRLAKIDNSGTVNVWLR